MKYIVHTRFKDKAICGNVNLPALTICEEYNNIIMYNDKCICYATSECAHKHFARNDDGQGMLRGKLTQQIQKTLAVRDNDYQKRWDKIWSNPNCRKYKRTEYEDYWLWNNKFFNAPIEDLLLIANLIGIKENKL